MVFSIIVGLGLDYGLFLISRVEVSTSCVNSRRTGTTIFLITKVSKRTTHNQEEGYLIQYDI